MKFSQSLKKGQFLKRYKRFFADILLPDGQQITVHVPNTGSLKTLVDKPTEALFSTSNDPNRKLPYTLEALKDGNTWVGINTRYPNQLLNELFTQKWQGWQSYGHYLPEFKISKESRLDGCLLIEPCSVKRPTLTDFDQLGVKAHFLEAKNVTMGDGERVVFPDSVSERAQKHLRDLVALVERGHTAEIVFVIQRDDKRHFSPADTIDPLYGKTLREVVKKGVKATVLSFKMTPESLEFTGQELPLIL